MVQVPEACPRVEVRGEQPVDSGAITRDAIAKEAVGLPELELPSAALQPKQPPVRIDAAVSGASGTSDYAVPDPDAAALGFPAAWENPSTRRTRQFVLVGTVAFASIGLAATLFVMFVRQRMAARDTVVLATESDPSTPATDPSTEGAETGQPTTTDAADTQPADTDNSSAEDQTAAAPVVVSNTEPNEPVSPVEEPERPAVAPAETSEATPANISTGRSNPDSGNAGSSPSRPAVNAAVEQGLADLPPELRAFAPLVTLGAGSFDQPPPAQKVPVPALPPSLKPPIDSGQHPPPASSGPLGTRGDQKLTGLQLSERPWVDSLRILEQLMVVPIWLDYESLDAGGVDLRERITIQPTRTTVLAGLQAILESVGAEVIEEPAGFLKVRASPQRLEQVPTQWGIHDLVADAAQAESLVELLNALTAGFEDETPLALDPTGTQLMLSSDPLRRWQVTLALEAIRRGRGLPPTIDTPSIQRWLIDSGLPSPALSDEPVRLPTHPMAANELIGRLVGSETSVVLDWPACWEHGLTPNEVLLPWQASLTPQQIVEETLAPYALKLVARGVDLWAVTTAEAFALEPQWATVPIVDDREEPLVKRLNEALAAAPATGRWVVATDSVGKQLVACLPRYLAAQLSSLASPPADGSK
jgi:hypothetical protein